MHILFFKTTAYLYYYNDRTIFNKMIVPIPLSNPMNERASLLKSQPYSITVHDTFPSEKNKANTSWFINARKVISSMQDDIHVMYAMIYSMNWI